jgi:hypothetical protein
MEQSGFHEIGDDRHILPGLFHALFDRTDAVSGLEANVPQQIEEIGQALPVGRFFGSIRAAVVKIEENQNIDIGVRVQLASAIAPYRNKCELFGVGSEEMIPAGSEQFIDEIGARPNQFGGWYAGVKALG